MVKMTFTFDEQTTEALRRAAARLKKPQSAVVREAIKDYASRADRLGLGEDERHHMLRVLDRIMARPSVKAEIKGILAARRTGGRRTKPE